MPMGSSQCSLTQQHDGTSMKFSATGPQIYGLQPLPTMFISQIVHLACMLALFLTEISQEEFFLSLASR